MEVPFYYTLKEFEENYKNDLKLYINNYPSADESDFLSELKDSYNLFVSKTDKYRFLGYKVKLDIVSGFSEFNPIYEDRYFNYNQYLDKLKGKIGTYLLRTTFC